MDEQNDLRKSVRKRCMSQKEVAGQIGISNVHLNYWLKEKKELGPKTVEKVKRFLED